MVTFLGKGEWPHLTLNETFRQWGKIKCSQGHGLDLWEVVTYMYLRKGSGPILTINKVLGQWSRGDTGTTSIETGVTAIADVNTHEARSVGSHIISSLKGQDTFCVSFKRNMQVVTIFFKDSLLPQTVSQRMKYLPFIHV